MRNWLFRNLQIYWRKFVTEINYHYISKDVSRWDTSWCDTVKIDVVQNFGTIFHFPLDGM